MRTAGNGGDQEGAVSDSASASPPRRGDICPTAAPAPLERRWSRRKIHLLALLLAASVCAYTDRLILPLLQELIKPELKLSDADLGLATGPAFALFYALSGLPIARLAERFNRVRLLAGAVALWSVMTAACGAVMGLPTLLLARLGVGFGEGGCTPVSHSLLSDHFPARQRGAAMAVLSTGGPLAGVLMPVIGGYVAHVWGWRFAFLFLGITGALLAMLIALTLRDPRATGAVAPPRPERLRADLGWLARSPSFVWIFFGGALMGIGQAGFRVFLPSFMIRVHGLSIVEAGTVIGMMGLTGVAGTFIGGWMADRFSGRFGRSYPLTCGIGGLLTGAMYLGALEQRDWTMALIFLLAGALASDLKTAPNYAAVQNVVPPRMRATAAAVFMIAATLIGGSIGPAAAGFVSDHFAGAAFPTALGAFATVCPGGHAAATAPEAARHACLAASAAGLHAALGVIAFSFLGSGIAFIICSRFFRTHEDNA